MQEFLQQYLLLIVVGVSAGVCTALAQLRGRFGSTPDYATLKLEPTSQDTLEFIGWTILEGAGAAAGSWFSLMIAFGMFHEEWKMNPQASDFGIVAAVSAGTALLLTLAGFVSLARTRTLKARLGQLNGSNAPAQPDADVATSTAGDTASQPVPSVSLTKRKLNEATPTAGVSLTKRPRGEGEVQTPSETPAQSRRRKPRTKKES